MVAHPVGMRPRSKEGVINLPPLKKGDRGGFSSIDPSYSLGGAFGGIHNLPLPTEKITL